MDVTGRIAQANGRLKNASVRVRVEQIGDRLYLRATLPPKPDSTKTAAYQQRIAIGLGAHPRGVSQAETEARKIGALVESREFTWEPYLSHDDDRDLVQACVDRFKAFCLEANQGGISETTWRTDYQGVLNRLPADRPLTLDLLVSAVEATEKDSKQRRRTATTLAKLARFVGLDDADLKALRGKYSAKEVDPRQLPTDIEIGHWRSQVTDPGWRWAYGMLAAYGLRPHELFRLDLQDFPTIYVDEDTKTGKRFVFPLYPEWVEQWKLDRVTLPPIRSLELSNARLGGKVSKFFGRSRFVKQGEGTLTAYDLRHCFSRRCFEFGLSPDMGAKLMGHSVEVHTETYRRWIDLGTYQRIYSMAINRGDRPVAPGAAGTVPGDRDR